MKRFYENHVFSTLTVLAILAFGIFSFVMMPRDKAPAVSFHWLVIQTFLTGANAQDIEKSITHPIEQKLRGIGDIKFSQSTSREHVSDILVRFENISDATFDRHVNDIKSQLSMLAPSLPAQASASNLIEINSANTFASATLMFTTDSYTDEFLLLADRIKQKIQGLQQVEQVSVLGSVDKVIDIIIDPYALDNTALSPMQLEGLLRAKFDQNMIGNLDSIHTRVPVYYANASEKSDLIQTNIPTDKGVISLGDFANIESGFQVGPIQAGYQGQSGYLFSIMKKPNSNLIKLMSELHDLIAVENKNLPESSQLILIDDQSTSTHNALKVMYDNATIGLVLVLFFVGLFLGLRLALIMCVAIPVIFAGTFTTLYSLGQTLNITVLLGCIVVLGMVVDDSIVIMESIDHHLKKGKDKLQSIVDGLREVIIPVTCTVLTTIATFIPLMLLPGILGQFMFVLPLVVTLALIFSLLEGCFIMPSHIYGFSKPNQNNYLKQLRCRLTRKVTQLYVKSLIQVLRKPYILGGLIAGLLFVIASFIYLDKIKIDFFNIEPGKVFYLNIDMPQNTHDKIVWEVTEDVARQLEEVIKPVSFQSAYYTGIQFAPTGVDYGQNLSQILISLNSQEAKVDIEDLINKAQNSIDMPIGHMSFHVVNDGPPLTDTLDVKLTGANLEELSAAQQALASTFNDHPGIRPVFNDKQSPLALAHIELDESKIYEKGLNPGDILYRIQMVLDPIPLKQIHVDGIKQHVRLGFQSEDDATLERFKQIMVHSNTGYWPLSDFVKIVQEPGYGTIKHFNFERMVEVSFYYDKEQYNAIEASEIITQAWESLAKQHTHVSFQFHGMLDDILETVKMIPWVMCLGLFLVYWILGVQFKSFTQPLIIFVTTPLAMIGVLTGLIVSGYPLSIYSMYGAIALIGVAVNAAILLISAANQRRQLGMRKRSAMIFAAKRRLLPIVISTLTTIAGLSSLCFGWGGDSLLWGPVAAAIVYGLGVSTLLTLYCIPLLYIGYKRESQE